MSTPIERQILTLYFCFKKLGYPFKDLLPRIYKCLAGPVSDDLFAELRISAPDGVLLTPNNCYMRILPQVTHLWRVAWMSFEENEQATILFDKGDDDTMPLWALNTRTRGGRALIQRLA